MHRVFVRTIVAIVLLATRANGTPILGLNPSVQVVSSGAMVSVDLTISGLGDAVAPSLSTFDVDIFFDPTVVTFANVIFGDSLLGDQLDLFGLGSLTSFDGSVPGLLNLFELSFDDPLDLDELQAGSFTLATITFLSGSPGKSSLDLSVNALGDSFGDPLTATVSNGSVRAVPLPDTLQLLLAALLCLGVARKIQGGTK